ncbi:unnamed protein product [Brassicogethes aeneus]|uniref:Eukaryotic translation initiation factor 4 gamma 2 n=1 Tax=Brassicogethes aeneus TaxID=1431903 RepID=A0A9P0FKJ4_BRAAE|nr:unnamed protein product [Brassicogethes aeneus]
MKDEESLECLCKLLTTIGKDLENDNVSLEPIFKGIRDVVEQRPIKVSSRVKLMLQDVMDLRSANWMPQKHDANPKIQKEADTNENTTFSATSKDAVPKTISRKEKLDVESLVKNNPPPTVSAAPQAKLVQVKNEAKAKETKAKTLQYEDDSNYMVRPQQQPAMPSLPQRRFKRGNRPNAISIIDPDTGKDRLNEVFGENSDSEMQTTFARQTGRNHRAQQHFSVQSDKLKSKPPQMEEMSLGRVNLFNTWGKGSNIKNVVAPPMGAQSNNIYDALEKANSGDRGGGGGKQRKNNVGDDGWIQTGRNHRAQQHFSVQSDKLKSKPPQMEEMSLGSANLFNTWGKGSNIKNVVAPPMGAQSNNINAALENANESDSYTQEKKSGGGSNRRAAPVQSYQKLEFLNDANTPVGEGEFTCDRIQAEITKFFLDKKNVDKLHSLGYKLQYKNDANTPAGEGEFTYDQIQAKLTEFFINKKNVDEIGSCIGANVGDRVKENKFIRALVTAILKDSIKKDSLSVEIFHRHLVLLQKYIDNNSESELQCLYAVQSLVNEMGHPKGLLLSIVHNLYEPWAISLESFLAWEASTDPAEQAGKGVALKQLNQFLTELKDDQEDFSIY